MKNTIEMMIKLINQIQKEESKNANNNKITEN